MRMFFPDQPDDGLLEARSIAEIMKDCHCQSFFYLFDDCGYLIEEKGSLVINK